MRFVVVILALLLPAGLWAQNTSSSISGSVCDSADSIMPGIEVKLSNELGRVHTISDIMRDRWRSRPRMPFNPYRLQACRLCVVSD